jgi:hypothetical protein
MDESNNEVFLDEMPTPGGAFELVAYQSRGTVWVGIRPKGWRRVEGSPTESACGLHTGSQEHFVETTASIYGTWGVAFGAVAPEVERVSVRNERRELFPATIIPLPPSFGEEFRAAWGVASNCESDCELIGYDARGRLIAPSTIWAGERRDLSPEESLEQIRQHCDNGLRYYTWALSRMPSIPDQAGDVNHVRNLRSSLAHVLAYVEGATDERDAMVARDEIVLRYIAAVEDEGWEPPFAHGDG